MHLLWLLYIFSAFPKIILGQTTTEALVTPVVYWAGRHTWATFLQEEKECWNNSKMADIIRGTFPPDKKKILLTENSCRMDYGLECVQIEDKSANPPTFKHACRCMISLGSQPAIDNADGANAQCYIPAGRGEASKCFSTSPTEDNTKLPPYGNVGFPFAFGDPQGLGPDPPQLKDIFTDTDVDITVTYVPWNSVKLRCAPNSECREGSNFLDRRCQCFKSSTHVGKTGLCSSYARKITVNPGLFLVISILFLKK